jgi:hypothetical protein
MARALASELFINVNLKLELGEQQGDLADEACELAGLLFVDGSGGAV